MPLLVRTDTLQYLDPRDVVQDYKFPDFSQELLGPNAIVEAGCRSRAWVALWCGI